MTARKGMAMAEFYAAMVALLWPQGKECVTQVKPDLAVTARIRAYLLLLWSTNADESKWVPQEIGRAIAKGKPIMPVVLHPRIKLTGFIQDLKYLEWYKNPEAAVAWLNDFVMRERTKKDQRELMTLALGVGAILFAFGGNE